MSTIANVLSRGDYSEKARAIREKVSDPRFDPQSLLEELPTLLHLIGELSRSDMKDAGGSSSPWITEAAAQTYLDLLGISRERWSVLHWLGGSTSYNFPIGSLPIHVFSAKDLVCRKYIPDSVDRLVSRSVLTLHALDYWYLGFAFLPLVDLGSSSWASSGYSAQNQTKWHDEAKAGSIYQILLEQYVDALDRGGALVVALWIDFILNPMLFTSTVLNYKKLFRLISVMGSTLWTEHRSQPLCAVFHERLSQLLCDLFSPSSFASKFIHRIDLPCCASLISLWREQVDRVRDPALRKLGSSILQSGPITDFISDTESAFASTQSVSAHQNSQETKQAFGAIIHVLEVVDLVEDSPTMLACWEACRQCTWHEERVPRNLYEESLRMDVLVNKYPQILSWDPPVSKTPTAENGIPRSVSVIPKNKRSISAFSIASVTWATPASSQEYALVILWLGWTAEQITGHALEGDANIFLRKLANVHVVIGIFSLLWICVSLVGAAPIGYMLCLPVIVISTTKAIASQYIV